MKLPKIYATEVKPAKINLTLSDNPLRCSRLVLKKLATLNSRDISEYPNDLVLKNTLAGKFDIDPNDILLGSGSEQLIKLICQTLLKRGGEVFVPRGSFAVFTKEALLQKARIKFFDQGNLNIAGKPTLCFICNPNNPTGEALSNSLIIQCVQKFPQTTFVIDEANGEFLSKSFASKIKLFDNAIVLKTFSKAFGLAGLRVGFAIGPSKLIGKLSLAQQVFPVSSVSCQLAIQSLEDDKFIVKALRFFATEREFLQRELLTRELKTSKSVTNNIFVFTDQAQVIEEELQKRNVAIIDAKFFPGMDKPGFRISIRDRKTNRLFLKTLDEALACAGWKKLLRSKEAV